jgi:hypothetical protein
MAFAEFNSCHIIIAGGSGILNLSDAIIRDGSRILLYSTGGDCYIERNIFINAGNIQVTDAHDTYIRNNVFYEQIEVNILDGGNSTGQTYVQYNSFLSTDRVALKLAPYVSSAEMVAINNFWNTTDAGIIDSMIYDRNDDLNVSNYIEYIPFRTAPHPDTPIPDFNQAPIADCGDDQVVFDEVILDGSDSYDPDPDGSIVSYYWTLQHRTNSANDRDASGENPTVYDLNPGFYDVSLTVTDDGGLVGVDNMLLVAAGLCGIEQCLSDLTQCSTDLTEALDTLAICSGNLSQCDGDLYVCQIGAELCNSSLSQCSEDLSQAEANLQTCTGNLAQVQQELVEKQAELETTQSQLEQALADLAEAVADADGDGLVDVADACSDTLPGSAVDQIGCSLAQFCGAIDASTQAGIKLCKAVDWQNDEPLGSPKDCKALKQGKGMPKLCVPVSP